MTAASRCPTRAARQEANEGQSFNERQSSTRRLEASKRSSPLFLIVGGNRFHDAPVLWRFEARFGTLMVDPIFRKGCRTRSEKPRVEGRKELSLTIENSTPPSIETISLFKKKKQVLRVSAFSVGLVYGSWKLSSLKSTAAKAAAEKEKAASHGGH